MANSIKVKLAYRGYDSVNPATAPISDFTRQYTFKDVSSSAMTPVSIQAAVEDFNRNVTEDPIYLQEFFVADDGGYCAGVIEVIAESVTETPIHISGGEG